MNMFLVPPAALYGGFQAAIRAKTSFLGRRLPALRISPTKLEVLQVLADALPHILQGHRLPSGLPKIARDPECRAYRSQNQNIGQPVSSPRLPKN